MTDILLIFSSVHQTLEAEEILLGVRAIFQVVPVPPHVNQGCGLGIKLGNLAWQEHGSLLKDRGVQLTKVVEC